MIYVLVASRTALHFLGVSTLLSRAGTDPAWKILWQANFGYANFVYTVTSYLTTPTFQSLTNATACLANCLAGQLSDDLPRERTRVAIRT
jgi:hypothetical protein